MAAEDSGVPPGKRKKSGAFRPEGMKSVTVPVGASDVAHALATKLEERVADVAGAAIEHFSTVDPAAMLEAVSAYRKTRITKKLTELAATA